MHKTIGCNFDAHEIAALLKVEMLDATHRDAVVGKHTAERAKIVFADQGRGSNTHRVEIERLVDVKRATREQRRRLATGKDRVDIRAFTGGKARGERSSDDGNVAHRKVVGQNAIECNREPFKRKRAGGRKRNDLSARMDSSVGATRRRDTHRLFENSRKRILKHACDRPYRRLKLKPTKRRPVILDDGAKGR